MKYSVIIPIYNCARYLESCVESVLKQKTDAEYEIILVNDGSTDGSAQLSDRLAEEHGCIRVIHQTNQGVSAARNTGICAAKGEYLLFLDADDLWSEDLLQLVDIAAKDHPDIVQFGYRTFYEDGRIMDFLAPSAVNGETGADYMMRVLDKGRIPLESSCTNAHRKDFLVQNDLAFPVGVVFGEDLLFRIRELGKAKSICGVDEALYMYRRNTGSATRNMSLKKMQDLCMVWAEFYRQFPKSIVADYYCMNLVSVAELDRKDARILMPLLAQNRDMLTAVRGMKPRITRTCFALFGFYNGARVVRLLIRIKNG